LRTTLDANPPWRRVARDIESHLLKARPTCVGRLGVGTWDLNFGIWGLELRVRLGFRVERCVEWSLGTGVRVWGLGLEVWLCGV